jgi:hypothetical protein
VVLYQTLLLAGAIGFFAMVTLGTFHGGRGGHSRINLGKYGKMKGLFFFSALDIFAIFLGMGAAGLLLKSYLNPSLLLAVAISVGVAFDFFFLKPLFNFALKFVSTPSDGLEGMIAQQAVADSNFDSTGKGLVLLIIDGEEIRLLARLDEADRVVKVKIMKGDRVMVTDINSTKNECTVSKF